MAEKKIEKVFGPMDVDYRVRAVAVVPEINVDGYYMPKHQKIFYGLDAVTIAGIQSKVFDLTQRYIELSNGGRRPGAGVGTSKHFFNKRIMTDEEKYAGFQTIQSGRHALGLGARDEVRGAGSDPKVEATAGGAGGGDRGPVVTDWEDVEQRNNYKEGNNE